MGCSRPPARAFFRFKLFLETTFVFGSAIEATLSVGSAYCPPFSFLVASCLLADTLAFPPNPSCSPEERSFVLYHLTHCQMWWLDLHVCHQYTWIYSFWLIRTPSPKQWPRFQGRLAQRAAEVQRRMKAFFWLEASQMSVWAVGSWFLLCISAGLAQARQSNPLVLQGVPVGCPASAWGAGRGFHRSFCGRWRPVACVMFVKKAGPVGGWLAEGHPGSWLGGGGERWQGSSALGWLWQTWALHRPTCYLVLSRQFLWGSWRLAWNKTADFIAVITFPQRRR